eukprot:6214531-Pleurochrysis_carterae.AAC.1
MRCFTRKVRKTARALSHNRVSRVWRVRPHVRRGTRGASGVMMRHAACTAACTGAAQCTTVAVAAADAAATAADAAATIIIL